MHKTRFTLSVGLAIFLLVLPEPITTFLGLALLSWAVIHFGSWVRTVNGACRCDACRYGIPKASHSFTFLGQGEVSTFPSPFPAANGSYRMQRVRSTLPLTRGRDLTRYHMYSNYPMKGGHYVR